MHQLWFIISVSKTVSGLESSGGVYLVPGFHGLQVYRLPANFHEEILINC